MRVFFPVNKDGVAEPPFESRARVREHSAGAVDVLVAEDEQMLRDFVSEALSSLGYRVLAAANGRQALELWAANRDDIDLLMTDIVMPEFHTGRQLEQQLHERNPT